MQRAIPFLGFFRVRWRQLSIVQRGTIAITIPLFCLVISLSTHLWLRQKSLQTEAVVDHNQTLLLQSHTLLVDLLNAETGVRGYYVTHRKDFLEPYEVALLNMPKTLDRLNQLMRNNPAQLEQLQMLKQLIDERLSILRYGIGQVDYMIKHNSPPPKSPFPVDKGKRLMDQFRAVLRQMETEAQQQLEQNQKSLQQQRDLNLLVILLGVVISSLGSAIAIGLFRDLAQELRQREMLLQESHNLIQAVFANVVDGVVVLNAQGQIESLNASAEKMFGYPLQNVVGQSWTMLITEDTEADSSLNFCALSKIEKFEVGHPWQAMGQRQDGAWFLIEISLSLVDLDDRHIMIIRDITERQQSAAKLQARADELAKLNSTLRVTNNALAERNQELDQFAYVVSHDLKAPLRAIASLSQWIEEDLADQLPVENQMHMQLLRGRVHRMESLLDGLLDYARLGRTEIPITTVDVADLLVTVLSSLSPPSTFRVEIAANMPVLQTRQLLLQQVFMNLIGNAIEHHPSEMGTVKISVQDRGDRYEFAIADDGQGIDPQFHDKIYTIFQTLQARDTRESRGVGLAVVKKIVEMEGGKIQLNSALGKGATFRFTWPKQARRQDQESWEVMSIDRSI